MTSILEHLKKVLADESVKALRFVNGTWYQECKIDKNDIIFLDDGIMFTEKKGDKHLVYIPLHSTTIFVIK